jgi:hypothetical protein
MVTQGPGWVISALRNSPTVSLTTGTPVCDTQHGTKRALASPLNSPSASGRSWPCVGNRHPITFSPMLARMATEDLGTVAMEAFDRVGHP